MSEIGSVGLAVMGENLVLNIIDNGFSVSVYNRSYEKTIDFISKNKIKTLKGTYSLKELCESLSVPRKIILMVKAGKPVEETVLSLLPFLEKGDLIVDGGNSFYLNTEKLIKTCNEKGIYYIGCGVSGGEEGARNGPAIMPGGDKRGWPLIENILKKISAKNKNTPCCDWIGNGGAGHFIKMVHNGIEYGEMQLICETYSIMKNVFKMCPEKCADVFEEWLKEEHNSFLLKITIDILRKEKGLLLERIRDAAYQKGTGKWFVESAMSLGVPVGVISESVFSRDLSVLKDLRKAAQKLPKGVESLEEKIVIKEALSFLRQALYLGRLFSYSQGFLLIKKADLEYNWELNYKTITQIWSNGCILRSLFIEDVGKAFDRNQKLECLLFDEFFKAQISSKITGLRKCVSFGALSGVSIPAFSVGLSFYDGLCTKKLTTNLIQAQRDYFGAHLYELEDQEGVFIHTNWTEK